MISEKADKMTDLLVGACVAYGCTNSQKMHELLLEAVTQLHTYIAELEAECRWIPVSERLPVDKKRYMTIVMNCFDGSRDVYRLRYYGDGNWFSWTSEINVVTHWKEDPELPEVQ